MAAAELVFEWACEVIGTNLAAVLPESMPVRFPPLSWDRVSLVPEIESTAFAVK